VQMSGADTCFPGTTNRIMLVGGPVGDLVGCISRYLKQLAMSQTPINNLRCVKLAVPFFSATKLMGLQGDQISFQTHCRIYVSRWVEGVKERIVVVFGDVDHLSRAVTDIAQLIQSDQHLKDTLTMQYDIRLPLGAWSSGSGQPADPSIPLIPAEDAELYTKSELIQYLILAAPLEILVLHNLTGGHQRRRGGSLKRRRGGSLKEALEATMDARVFMDCGDTLALRERPAIREENPERLRGEEELIICESSSTAVPFTNAVG